MKVWKNKKGVSPVIATILMVAITVVLAAVLYVMVMGMISPTTAPSQPLGLVAEYKTAQKAIITVSSAPTGAVYDGATIVLLNETTGVPTAIGSVVIYKGGKEVINKTFPAGSPAKLIDTDRNPIAAGDYIVITLPSTNYLSPGDKIQISGIGFSTSTATISA
ncbi:MAG: archaellin/type IV pilin N-terminal domain-containing protein [Thermoplasmata archaeon]